MVVVRPKPYQLLSLVLAAVVVGEIKCSVTRQQEEHYCLARDPQPYLRFATKTPYVFARGRLDVAEMFPKGCVAVQMWHMIRHGTRYPSMLTTLAMLYHLPKLKEKILKARQAGNGELCGEDLSLLTHWSLADLSITSSFRLAAEGKRELKGLASRYKAALPHLLDRPFTNDSFKFRHTASHRTKASAKAYAKGLFGRSVYMPAALRDDPLLKFDERCSKHIEEVEYNPEATVEVKRFIGGRQMAAVISRVSRRLGVKVKFSLLMVIYDACRFYKAWKPSSVSVWCAAFTSDDLKILEYVQDLIFFYKDGYGNALNYEMACLPLQDLLQNFRAKVEESRGPRGLFYFSHREVLVKVIARLGLYQDASMLTHSHMNINRLWQTSRIGSFGMNLAFILSFCGQDKWWVSVVLNEKPVQLPGCPSSQGCSWEDFLHFYNKFEDCDFDKICHNSKSKS